jgi:hypothetical protein
MAHPAARGGHDPRFVVPFDTPAGAGLVAVSLIRGQLAESYVDPLPLPPGVGPTLLERQRVGDLGVVTSAHAASGASFARHEGRGIGPGSPLLPHQCAEASFRCEEPLVTIA